MKNIIICAMAIVLLQALPAVAGKTYNFQYQKIVDVETTLQLTINNASGNIIITTNSDRQLKVDAVKNIYADSKEEADLVADRIQIAVSSTEGHITIEPQFLRIPDRSPSFWEKLFGKSGDQSYGSVDFVISVPVDCNADIYNMRGNVEVAGVRGRILVNGTAGDINVRDNLGDVEITTTSGNLVLNDIEGRISVAANGSDISFYSVTGNMEIRNSSGRTEGQYLMGDLTMSQTTGSVNIKYVDGDVRLKTKAGSITIAQDFGALDISTESGDIQIQTELNSPKDYFVETISGSIRFMIPEASGGEVKLEAGSGRIDTQIPISIESFSRTRIAGSFGNGGPRVTLATMSGDITLTEF